MPATPEAVARTRAFARVLGPVLTLVPMIVVLRVGQMEALLAGFFANAALAWTMGTILLVAGLFIIAHHQIWSTGPSIVVSLLGWIFALRGIVLLAAPELIERAAATAITATPWIRVGFAVPAALGLWLTHAGWLAKAPSAS